MEFVDYDPKIEIEILNENKEMERQIQEQMAKEQDQKDEEHEHGYAQNRESMDIDADESENKDLKIGLHLHDIQHSNTMVSTPGTIVISPDSDETLKVSSNHQNMRSETISIQNFNISTPKFYSNDDHRNSNENHEHHEHRMDFSMDSLTNIAPINGTDAMIPTLATPHSTSQSAVHANYFDAAPTASTLITANRNKFHFITLPSNINQKTSIKSGNQLISSSASKLNHVKMKPKADR